MRIAMLSGVLVLDSVLRKLCAKCLNQKNKTAGTQSVLEFKASLITVKR
jgi:hypothetical protein